MHVKGFSGNAQGKKWNYILRFKEGSIPYAAEEYERLRKKEPNRQEEIFAQGRCWYDYVNGIEYNGYRLNLAEYVEKTEREILKEKGRGKKQTSRSLFLTDLSVTKRNVGKLVEYGRRRWRIENEGYNMQKRQGYCLEHQYSKNYQAMKNHYYLIQIGHMIAQVME